MKGFKILRGQIVEVTPNSPASRAGLYEGMAIRAINGVVCNGGGDGGDGLVASFMIHTHIHIHTHTLSLSHSLTHSLTRTFAIEYKPQAARASPCSV